MMSVDWGAAASRAAWWMQIPNEGATAISASLVVFVLHHYLGLPLVEVAELLEIPAGTARSRLHYATAGLREALVADSKPIVQEGRLA